MSYKCGQSIKNQEQHYPKSDDVFMSIHLPRDLSARHAIDTGAKRATRPVDVFTTLKTNEEFKGFYPRSLLLAESARPLFYWDLGRSIKDGPCATVFRFDSLPQSLQELHETMRPR